MSDAAPQQPARKLTKREKKALDFRAKKKGKAVAPSFEDEVAAIEGQEDDGVDVEEGEQVKRTGDKGSKKRKRDEEGEAKEEDAAANEGEEEQPKKKKRQRGKTKAQREREAREGAANGEGGEGHHRLLLFVGECGSQWSCNCSSCRASAVADMELRPHRQHALLDHGRRDQEAFRAVRCVPRFLRLATSSCLTLSVWPCR